jgi:hypothetical protein
MYRATLIPVGFSAHASLILLPYAILLVPGIPHVALRPDVVLVACEGVGLSQPTGRLGWRSHAL